MTDDAQGVSAGEQGGVWYLTGGDPSPEGQPETYRSDGTEQLTYNNPYGDFFHEERLRALAGVALYALAGALGALVAFPIALAVFLLLPPFYAVTSEGLRASPLPTSRLERRARGG